ncbi:MAG: hypothetical protein CME23_03325 [Gemmatimonadetes bacterium]|nr:hypothetical protein [Gemmatimonadota bacterium]
MSDDPLSVTGEKRLKLERERIDRQYNDALTALDLALQQFPELPASPAAPDDSLITRLNELARLVPEGGVDYGVGWRGRIRRFVWRIIGPVFQRQHDFNLALIDHINCNIEPTRQRAYALDKVLTAIRDSFASQAFFQHKLMLYAQQITPYVNTKQPIMPLSVHEFGAGLAAGLDAVGDEIQIRAEANIVRERRFEARVEELRATVGALQQKLLLLTRQLEQQEAGKVMTSTKSRSSRRQATLDTEASPRSRLTEGQLSTADGAFKYVGFEDQFRGAPEEIRARMNEYAPDFTGAVDVLDVGCGRGEFLDVLKANGVPARGLDINPEMVKVCRMRGLDVVEGDVVSYLEGLDDGSLGGLFSAQVVEHLRPEYLIRLLELSYQKLRPRSKIVLETINPACWVAFFDGYIRDITHAQPLHPDTLTYLLHATGFQGATIRYSAPYPEHAKLQRVAVSDRSKKAKDTDELASLTVAFNDAADKINSFLFTHLDYAVIAERL